MVLLGTMESSKFISVKLIAASKAPFNSCMAKGANMVFISKLSGLASCQIHLPLWQLRNKQKRKYAMHIVANCINFFYICIFPSDASAPFARVLSKCLKTSSIFGTAVSMYKFSTHRYNHISLPVCPSIVKMLCQRGFA